MKKVTDGKSNCCLHFGQASFGSFEARISVTGYTATAHCDSSKRRGVTVFSLMIFYFFILILVNKTGDRLVNTKQPE
jgi:hypothetical protein